ncbi:hypothetical protein CEXT_315141 [Caerostris extrusa]|uniref:Uncharacterized protein n=1 Tax=Caerostris extrusa TaxID=172846 RepID=A0AAV4QFC1_CAEEX|nr:hypothetical protein CEXT_315141 [Caerostris extrusa]
MCSANGKSSLYRVLLVHTEGILENNYLRGNVVVVVSPVCESYFFAFKTTHVGGLLPTPLIRTKIQRSTHLNTPRLLFPGINLPSHTTRRCGKLFKVHIVGTVYHTKVPPLRFCGPFKNTLRKIQLFAFYSSSSHSSHPCKSKDLPILKTQLHLFSGNKLPSLDYKPGDAENFSSNGWKFYRHCKLSPTAAVKIKVGATCLFWGGIFPCWGGKLTMCSADGKSLLVHTEILRTITCEETLLLLSPRVQELFLCFLKTTHAGGQ